MKLSDYAAMQLGSEIVEEFEEFENESKPPHDFDSDNTAELDDEERFITGRNGPGIIRLFRRMYLIF